MVGIVVWIVASFGLYFALGAVGAIPESNDGRYAAALFCTFAAMAVGGWVNGLIRDKFPKFDKWNVP